MGWSYTEGMTKADLIKELAATWSDGTKCLKYTVKGNTMWGVMETADGRRWIACNIIQVDRKYGAGYKGMTESCGPCYYDCPLAYLDEVPVAGEYGAAWRTKVRAFHEDAAKTRAFAKLIKVGAKVTLAPTYEVRELTVVSLAPLLGTANGRNYRIPKNAIRAVA